MKTHTKYFKVAWMTIRVRSDFSMGPDTFNKKFKPFETNDESNHDISIHHHFGLHDFSVYPDLLDNLIFETDHWQIYKSEDYWLYKFFPSCGPTSDTRVSALFCNDHTRGDIFYNDLSPQKYEKGHFQALTLLGSDQILFSKLLCNRMGMIIHSNGFDIHGKGILLAGKSGAGKSTLSKMLKQKGFSILCDDRMFILKQDSAYQAAGNWCHGSIPDVSAQSRPLFGIFFLEQSRKNELCLIGDKKIAIQMLTQSMVKSFFTADEWEKTFKTIEDLVQNIKFYRLRFDLSGEICDILDELLTNNCSEQDENGYRYQ